MVEVILQRNLPPLAFDKLSGGRWIANTLTWGNSVRVDIDDPEPEYLTRSDIARILRVSAKQAGRLMKRMPILCVGRTHRRVSRADFDAWRLNERKLPDQQVMAEATRYVAAPR